LSWNCGVEGETDDPIVLALREQQKRNFLATLLLSQGVPMLLAGDEIGRTQKGNNNAYCQDNEISWLDWKLDRPRRELLDFTRYLIRLVGEHPVLRRRHFFQGRRIRGSEVKDLVWFRPDGKEMSDEDWGNSESRCFGLRLAGDAIEEVDDRGNRIVDDTLLILLNAHHEAVPFVLPAHRRKVRWQVLLDTTEAAAGQSSHRSMRGGEAYNLKGRSLALLRLPNHVEAESSTGEALPVPRRARRGNGAAVLLQ
jgi:glycogen operon protein